tara:strand:- start:50999 stop:51130 length:132 start_codon:yes stop_codon:yes gene_type:complete
VLPITVASSLVRKYVLVTMVTHVRLRLSVVNSKDVKGMYVAAM